MKLTHSLSLGLVLLSASSLSFAEEYGHNQHAHVHGNVSMTMAVDGKQVLIDLESPAINYLDFEHKAETDAEKKLVDSVKQQLNNPAVLFTFEGASCSPSKVDVDFSGEDEHHEEHADHEEHHADSDHDEHEEHHEHNHSDIDSHYEFTCDSTDKLTEVRMPFIQKFEKIEHVDVKWITGQGQGGAQLTAEDNILKFK